MTIKIVLLTVDRKTVSINVFVDDFEYDQFCKEVLDGYDDDRQRSIHIDIGELKTMSPFFTYNICKAICEKMEKRGIIENDK